MHEKYLTLKSTLTAAIMTLGAALGWKGFLLLAWLAAMALDYLSGTLAACREGQWDSATALQGLWHKGGAILVVTVADISDGVLLLMMEYLPLGIQWPGLVLPLVLAWYTITELGSILENAVRMGAKVPQWLVKLLKAGLTLTDRAAESAMESVK